MRDLKICWTAHLMMQGKRVGCKVGCFSECGTNWTLLLAQPSGSSLLLLFFFSPSSFHSSFLFFLFQSRFFKQSFFLSGFPTYTSCCCFTYPPAALFSGVVFRTRMRKGRVSCYILQLFIKDPWLKVEVCQDRVSFVR